MPYYPPDSAPEVPPMMPQASTPGPAPVPYGGPSFALAPDSGAPLPDVPMGSTPGGDVMSAVPGASPLAAPNVSPYEAGATSPVMFGADANPGGRDVVSGTVAGAVAAAEARLNEMQGDTLGFGSQIGDLMNFPPSPLDPGAGPGLTAPAGHYYDPPRAYGNEPQ